MQRLLRVPFQRGGDADRGEQHVAQLTGYVALLRHCLMQLRRLLVQLVQRALYIRPLEAGGRRLVLELFSPPKTRQAPRHTVHAVGHGLLALFLPLQLVPADKHRLGRVLVRRLRAVENGAAAQGREVSQLSLEEMTALWNEAKRS